MLVLPHPFSPPLDPMTNGVRVLVHDDTGATLIDTTIPGGLYDPVSTRGWAINIEGGVFTYRQTGDALPLIDGIKKIVVRNQSARTPGLLKFAVTGKSVIFSVAPENLPVRGTIVLDPPDAPTGQCGEAFFPGPAGLAPNCALDPLGNLLVCR